MTRRVSSLLLAFGVMILLVASGAQSADAGDKFSVSISPTAVQPGTTTAYSLAITNWSKSVDSADNAHVTVPAGFAVDPLTLSATTSGACPGLSWAGTLNLATSTIDLTALDAPNALCPGGTLNVSFGATAPGSEGSYEWTTTLKLDGTQFSLQEAQPSVAVDSTPPTVTLTTAPPDPSSDPSPTFAFSASEAVRGFQCAVDSGAFADCSSPTTLSALSDGQHSFSVRATDLAGNPGSSVPYIWTVDTAAPPQPSIDEKPLSPSNDNPAVFAFSDAENGVRFECKLDAAAFAGCLSPTGYSVANGAHTFQVRALDAAGNVSSAASYTWTEDKTAPAIVLTTTPSNPSADPSPAFAFSASEPVTGFQCKVDTGAFAACSSPTTLSALSDGQHTFTVDATDLAGNTGSSAPYTWTIDTVNPVITLLSKPPSLTNATTASFSFTSSKPNTTFLCALDGAAFSACSSPATYAGLGNGNHSFTVKGKASTGNIGLPTTWAWTVDTVPPKTTITHGPDAVSSSPSATFTFTASEPVSGFACSLDGGAFAVCSSPKSFGGLADGQHAFRVRATDLAGNIEPSPPSYSWQVATLVPPDTTPPGPVTKVKPRVGYRSLRLDWALPPDFDLDHVQIVRTRQPSGSGATRVYEGRGSGYADRHFQNGTWYRYAIRSYDHAGNASRRVTVDVRPSALLRSPADGAVVKAPPLLLWAAIAKARYYNVQLYRGGHKVMSSWPVRARLQLKGRWKYEHYLFRLKKGRYRWYVWPAFGSASKPTFGQLIGTGTFTVR
jgi:Bacterial Ig-like domain